MDMQVDVVKANTVVHVATVGDAAISAFFVEFAQIIGFIEAASSGISLTRIHCRYVGETSWRCDFNLAQDLRVFTFITNTATDTVKTPSNEWFTVDERSTITRIHAEIERLRATHRLLDFDWTNS